MRQTARQEASVLLSLANRSRFFGIILRIGGTLHNLVSLARSSKGSSVSNMETTDKANRFMQNMSISLNPLPPNGFKVKRRSGHVVSNNLPKLLGHVALGAERRIATQLSPAERRRLLKILAKKKAALALAKRNRYKVSLDSQLSQASRSNLSLVVTDLMEKEG